mgnify:CR=1 FL=1
MTFGEKLKSIRKQAGMSQEKLAEKLGVSRQAVTKWETDAGIPDIENIMAISALFHISIDELLSNRVAKSSQPDYLYESVTEYDVDRPKNYDINLGSAHEVFLSGCEGEKIYVRLASNILPTLEQDFKVRIDDNRNSMDVDISRSSTVTEASAKESLVIFLQIPRQYLKKMELAVNGERVEVRNLECEELELDLKVRRLELRDVAGPVEIDCNLDMDIRCHSLNGEISVNQISASSRMGVPAGIDFGAVCKGIGTHIFYERDGKQVESFSNPEAEQVIELNGIKSELVIYPLEQGR